MGSGIRLRVRTDQSFEEFNFESPRQFRLFYISQEGHPGIVGKLPWDAIKKPLGRWLRDWVEKQDITAFEAGLQEHDTDVTLDSLLSGLRQTGCHAKEYFEAECSKRGGPIAFRIVWEFARVLRWWLEELRWRPTYRLKDGQRTPTWNAFWKNIWRR